MRQGITVEVSSADRARLTAIIADRNSRQKHVWRARIVLMTADGVGTNAIMRQTGKSKVTVWRWQERFMTQGLDGLLRDKTRPSRIRALPAAVRADDALRERLKALAEERRRFGYRRLWVLLRREGYTVNRKRVYRLYKEERLMVRRRGGRKRAIGVRSPMPLPLGPNQRWSLDFVHDQMTDGRRLRILTVVDDYTRDVWRWWPTRRSRASGSPASSTGSRRRARSAWRHRLGQWHRADLDRNPGLVGSAKGRLAQHRPGQAGAERLYRELQWPAMRRAAQRKLVPLTAARPLGAR
jgi:transposase